MIGCSRKRRERTADFVRAACVRGRDAREEARNPEQAPPTGRIGERCRRAKRVESGIVREASVIQETPVQAP